MPRRSFPTGTREGGIEQPWPHDCFLANAESLPALLNPDYGHTPLFSVLVSKIWSAIELDLDVAAVVSAYVSAERREGKEI